MSNKDNLSKYKQTIPKQIGKYISSQILFLVVIAFLGTYIVFSSTGIWEKLSCGLLMFIYAVSMYATAYEFGNHDMKSFSALKPYKWKGFAIGLIPAVAFIVIWAAYAFVWQGDGLTNVFEYIVNFIFVMGTILYYAFLIPYRGYVMIYGIVIAVLFPVVFSGLGYIAGMKNFDLTSHFRKFAYEKNKKNK